MRALGFGGFALSGGSAAALLAGCSGSQRVDVPTVIETQVRSHHQTFSYTGHEQTFRVPAGVTWITVVAQGAGGGGANGTGPTGGFGGRVRAQLPVRSGERLYVFVGGVGSMPQGGYNGGGQGLSDDKTDAFSSFGGGGASDIREGGKGLRHRVLVAGGGGSSFHERSARKYRSWQGWMDASGDGLIDISW